MLLRRRLCLAFAVALACTNSASSSTCVKNTLLVKEAAERSKVLVIAHRGASYHLPEHTLQGYRLALELQADFIEPDLVPTLDHQLVAIHAVDLNLTTNIHSSSIKKEPWYSDYMGRTGYWSFNYTLAEIQQLTVKQRLPDYRSTAFDGMFSVPSLSNILETLDRWNHRDMPMLQYADDTANSTLPGHPSPLQKFQSGLYVEIKESHWLEQEANINVVDILFDQLQTAGLYNCFETIKYNEYIVPSLILQSFRLEDLQRFHDKWKAQNALQYSEPPYILLVNSQNCYTEEFWFTVGEHRDLLSGIGCDIACLDHRVVVERAIEHNLVLHPWTERPETIDDERLHQVLCTHPVHGIFTESVDRIGRVLEKPCESSAKKHKGDHNTQLCYESQAEANYYVGISSFVLGVFVSLLVVFGFSKCNFKQRSMRVPTDDTDVPHTIELT